MVGLSETLIIEELEPQQLIRHIEHYRKRTPFLHKPNSELDLENGHNRKDSDYFHSTKSLQT